MIHDVDGRDKPGHDGNGAVISAILLRQALRLAFPRKCDLEASSSQE
jgi:hypothetical protein